MRGGKEDGTSSAPDTLARKSCWTGGEDEDGSGGLSPGGEITAVSTHLRAGRALQVPLASRLWLSHLDGCFLGGCTVTRVLAGHRPRP